ncbi:6-bladed beta-propeller [Algoriphagus sp. NG3]|uniref:6-bladed beta-propeller n=1 Tax=Algoriphagus sp. NG3 TaxID=3097546 RepID=UPI002A836C7E|nr:6-bladed beta-propeller [Algoriphagus sp. NG3]WPR76903.1 6-bladed beta-propeller [Algoriphagus sp. NG3]
MKQLSLFFILPFFSILFCCSSGGNDNSEKSIDGLEIIKVDLSKAREGKLSEFFEPEIEYIWLKDDVEGAQLGNLNKVFFREDKIFTLDIFGCKCIQIFDREGNFLSKIRAYGEGPKQYKDFDDATIVNNEVLLLGVVPPKLMWFSTEGEFLKEEKLKDFTGTGIYSENEKRYYFYSNPREPGAYFLQSVDSIFQDTLSTIPYNENRYYGSFSEKNSFKKSSNSIYFGMPFNDTIYQTHSGKLIPKIVFDFGQNAQNNEELKKMEENSNPLEELDFINKKAKLYFVPHQWFITESLLYSDFMYRGESFNVFFDRYNQIPYVLGRPINDDLNEGFDPFSINYQFNQAKVGTIISGKGLFDILQKKKAELGQEGFEEYVKGKGKNFAQAAFAAKDSENPVLIVYSVEK